MYFNLALNEKNAFTYLYPEIRKSDAFHARFELLSVFLRWKILIFGFYVQKKRHKTFTYLNTQVLTL